MTSKQDGQHIYVHIHYCVQVEKLNFKRFLRSKLWGSTDTRSWIKTLTNHTTIGRQHVYGQVLQNSPFQPLCQLLTYRLSQTSSARPMLIAKCSQSSLTSPALGTSCLQPSLASPHREPVTPKHSNKDGLDWSNIVTSLREG